MTGPYDGALGAISRLLRSDPVLPTLLGSADATLAVATPAQSVLIAALANFTERSPIVVVTSTGVDAERVADDLACLLPRRTADDGAVVVGAVEGPVAVLPAWETLPFERVSPEVETMGRRLALLWSLTHGEDDPSLPAPPRVIVAPIRALLQRLGPSAHDARPTTVRPGQELSVDELLARLIAVGYRREHQVEHRGEVAVRGGIVDVFPSTADTPVRIDLWGDEVDRLTTFAVNDQRSLADLDLAVFFGCRELIPTSRSEVHRGLARGGASRGGRRNGSAWPRARASTGWSRGSRTSTHARTSSLTSSRRGRRSSWSSPGGSATVRCSSSTRRRHWPRRWP